MYARKNNSIINIQLKYKQRNIQTTHAKPTYITHMPHTVNDVRGTLTYVVLCSACDNQLKNILKEHCNTNKTNVHTTPRIYVVHCRTRGIVYDVQLRTMYDIQSRNYQQLTSIVKERCKKNKTNMLYMNTLSYNVQRTLSNIVLSYTVVH